MGTLNILDFSDKLLLNIFRFLYADEIARVPCVCRRFNGISKLDIFSALLLHSAGFPSHSSLSDGDVVKKLSYLLRRPPFADLLPQVNSLSNRCKTAEMYVNDGAVLLIRACRIEGIDGIEARVRPSVTWSKTHHVYFARRNGKTVPYSCTCVNGYDFEFLDVISYSCFA